MVLYHLARAENGWRKNSQATKWIQVASSFWLAPIATTAPWRHGLGGERGGGYQKMVLVWFRLGVARSFLMLKAFFDFAIEITPQALAFRPNRRHQPIQHKNIH